MSFKKDGPLANEATISKLEKMALQARMRRWDERHPSGVDHIFVANYENIPLKIARGIIEASIFSLAKNKDMEMWGWQSVDRKKSVEVAPSAYGRATIFDADILIFLISQLMAGKNRGIKIYKRIRFVAADLLRTASRGNSNDDYIRLFSALDRLAGTRIKTNMRSGGFQEIESFGLIEGYRIVKTSSEFNRMAAIEVTLSEWIFRAILANEVSTLHKGYFALKKALERRLYQIAVKHVWCQSMWKIRLENLREKCGSKQKVMRRFIYDLVMIKNAGNLPDYYFEIDGEIVQFYNKHRLKGLMAVDNSAVDN